MRGRWLLLILATFLCLACIVAWRFADHRRTFDATGWRQDAEAGSGIRQAMADDLLARRTLVGLTRAEVVEMLGESSDSGYFKEYDLVYWLGDERGLISIDSEWLVIRIADGRVVEARLITD